MSSLIPANATRSADPRRGPLRQLNTGRKSFHQKARWTQKMIAASMIERVGHAPQGNGPRRHPVPERLSGAMQPRASIHGAPRR